ncbi:MAG: C40 family peptidase, partial [Myxococcota bacterium]|nr:C40 family peptidase [Myxococcota bacterium]MDW8364169.1 NlpC/P60 family protein [Myxococcales bacterium]
WREGGADYYGCDCWGLVRLVYYDELGIVLPEYGPDDPRPRERIVDAEVLRWERVEGAWRDGDVALLTAGRAPVHVGLIADGHRLLHALPSGARLDDLRRGHWRARVRGVYRWTAVARS